VPKKKRSKKKRADKDATPEEKLQKNGGAFIEEVDDSADSRPQSRAARIEEVEDDDA